MVEFVAFASKCIQLVHEIGDFRGYTNVLGNVCYSLKLDFVVLDCVNDPTFTYLNLRDV